jgi:hypothetical protein
MRFRTAVQKLLHLTINSQIYSEIPESKINLKIHIFCKHMAILSVLRSQHHHAKAKESYFTFLQT